MNITEQPERTLIGIESRASNDNPQAIGTIWQRFMAEQLAAQIPNRSDGHLIAIYCDYDGDHTEPYTFFLGCTVNDASDLPSGFTIRTLPAGRYVRRHAAGEMPAALVTAWRDIWTSDLDRAYDADFEIHDPTSPQAVDIFVGVA